jgi:hypothetical protein
MYNTRLLSRLTCILFFYLYRIKKFREVYKMFPYKQLNSEPRWDYKFQTSSFKNSDSPTYLISIGTDLECVKHFGEILEI